MELDAYLDTFMEDQLSGGGGWWVEDEWDYDDGPYLDDDNGWYEDEY